MNLNAASTQEQLRDLLASGDDRAGHHVLWVSRTGEVFLTRLPPGVSPDQFEKEHPEMRLRYETFEKGNEYVGLAAADDGEWVSQLFDSLANEWPRAAGNAGVTYVGLDRIAAAAAARREP
jgi:hypothetical protein